MDVDKLIHCVQGCAAIWDKSCSDYKDKAGKERSWNLVGYEMFCDWDSFGNEEKLIKVTELKNKWRHIRDNFLKFLNQGQSGDPPLKKKKYVYADALSFLQNSLVKRRTSGIVKEETKDQKESSPGSGIDPTRKERIKPVLTAFQAKQTKLESSREEDDSDKLFLLSLLDLVKKLTDDEKLDFRLHVLHFFQDIRTKKSVNSAPTTP